MTVRIAKEAGFCFGITRAVDIVEKLLDDGEKVATYGPLLHNRQMVEKLKSRGVVTIENTEEVPEGHTVVVRAHGLPWETMEQLKAVTDKISDATCPYVTKIHSIAQKEAALGKTALILGNEEHPEIVGIISYCQSGYHCFPSSKDFLDFLVSDAFHKDKQYFLIQQTTFVSEEYGLCKDFLKNNYTNVDIFATICKATMLRQQAAAELAKSSDLMIVVGGYNSSNTQKLYSICSRYCKTISVETKEELANYDFSGVSNVGVTAGASTPAFIIKEVRNSMSDVVNNTEELSFEEMLNESFKVVNTRDKVTAVVTSVAPNEIAVDIGTKHAGYVPLYEYTDDPNANLEELVKPGDKIDLMVLRLNDAEGTALLSKKRLDAIAGFEKIVEAEEAGELLTGKVVDIVRGGIIALTNGVRVFIPASQATLQRGQDLETLKGTEIEYKILETNKSRRRAVGSVRAVLQEERAKEAEAFWSTAEVGQERQGVVKSLTNYGAFVDLGGIDGMIHISELSWERIKHPSDVLKIGEEINVMIKDIDTETKKISLGYKNDKDNPWTILERDVVIGDIAMVKIVSMTAFGAFAQVIPGVDGLIHISQISHDRIEKPSDVLSIGMEVDAKITDIDFERRRVSLSMRALIEKEDEETEEGPREELVASATPEGTEQFKEVEVEEKPAPKKAAKAKEVAEEAVETALLVDVAETALVAEEVVKVAEEAAEDAVEAAKEVAVEEVAVVEEVVKVAKEVAEDVVEAAKEVAVEEVAVVEEVVKVAEEVTEEVVEDAVEAAKEVTEEVVEDAVEAAKEVAVEEVAVVEEVVKVAEEVAEDVVEAVEATPVIEAVEEETAEKQPADAE